MEEREAWEELLETEPWPGLFLQQDLTSASLRVAAVCGTREEADRLADRYGGEVEPLEERDWVAQGRESWRGRWLEAGNRMVVALDDDPAFLLDLQSRLGDRAVLVIPPEMAFGTGDHETTAVCLELVADFGAERDPGWSLLDLGTGSAILALAGCKAGAGRVVATDVDELALKIAARNLARNRIPPGRIELRREDVREWQPDERFDLVCANLYADLLLAVIPVLPRALKPGGRLGLAGILRGQEAAVAQALEGADLAVLQRVRRGEWTAFWVRARETPG